MQKLTFRCTRSTEEAAMPTARVEAFLDGKPLADGLVDVAAVIFGGAVERSAYYFYTCSCGVAGCEGYHQPLEHRRDGGRVTWTIEDEKLAEVFGASELTFDAVEFDKAREDLRTSLEALEAEGVYSVSMLDTAFSDEGDQSDVGIKLSELEHIEAYYQGQTDMAKARDAAADPNDPGMLRFSWNYPTVAEDHGAGRETFYEMSSVDVAAILLRLGESLSPEDAPRVAELPAAAKIIRDFARTRDADAANLAFAPFRRFLKEDEMDEKDATIFAVDASGPLVRHP